jgi:MazG family protein
MPVPIPDDEAGRRDPAGSAFGRMVQVLRKLLDPQTGCPWDLKQTSRSARTYVLEEVYELLEALEGGDPADIREELGDGLFMTTFLALLLEREGVGALADVLTAAADKMIRRHPHVFGDTPALSDAEAVKTQWSRIKAGEKSQGLLDSIPAGLPALMRAHRLTERAGQVGFDWDSAPAVLPGLDRELDEFRAALASGDRDAAAAELGDVLFTLVNLGRHLKINAEEALRGTNDRFLKRFRYIETELAREGRTPAEADLAEMDRLWAEAKTREG